MKDKQVKQILEAVIMAASRPIALEKILEVFDEKDRPDRKTAKKLLEKLADDYKHNSVELKEVASGYRFQIRKDYAEWVSRLWEEKPARYSRALLETLALVAYKQPITRGEIEKIRGVSVSSQIMKTLLEREWVHVVGHRDVPGKPAIYATTKQFLDYFNLKSLDELPPLSEIKDLDKIAGELDLPEPVNTAQEETTEQQGDKQAVVNLDVEDQSGDDVDVAEAMTAEH